MAFSRLFYSITWHYTIYEYALSLCYTTHLTHSLVLVYSYSENHPNLFYELAIFPPPPNEHECE